MRNDGRDFGRNSRTHETMRRRWCGGRRCGRTGLLTLLWLLLLAASPANARQDAVIEQPALVRVTVEPPAVELDHAGAGVQLVVTGHHADGSVRDVTRDAVYHPGDEALLQVEPSGRLASLDSGATVLSILVGELETKIPVRIFGDRDRAVSFQYDVLPVLSRQGCSSGACHGSPSGKGGFRLSLRAFDPVLDEVTLIREEFGRRTNPLAPEESLLLLKPTMRMPHGGGLRLRTADRSYAILRDWIAEGCRQDPGDAPRCVGIDVSPPPRRQLRYDFPRQQYRVTARFSDGTARDVTHLAVFSSSNEQVATIDEHGLATGQDRGEVAIIVRYLEFIESRSLTLVKDIPGFAWSAPPAHNFIDELVDAKLRQLQFLPSDVCTDDEFLRRVYLDVVGHLPTIDETRSFLADTSPDKRSRLIDDLLQRPEHARYWALKWGDVLRMSSKQIGEDGVFKYHRWVERAIANNMPYDQFARELLVGSGSTLANPAANFYRTAVDTNDSVETVSQVFLGARLQCAKCHNHPFERWTQDNYYGMAAFFDRVRRLDTQRPGEQLVYTVQEGEVTQPRTGEVMQPWVPGAGPLGIPDSQDRREHFADWLTRPDNPYFARIEANRIWSNLFARGIVDPPDDFRESNPPSNAQLLDALAEELVTSGYDRRHLLRTILNSRTYQASYRTNAFNEEDDRYFSHQEPRLLPAEPLLDAICHVTGIPEEFGNLPAGTLASHLPAPDLFPHEFLKTFGQPERQTVCQCERTRDSNLGMAIQFFNGDLLYQKLKNEQNRFRRELAAGTPPTEIIQSLYLAGLCREAGPEELQQNLAYLRLKQTEAESANADVRTRMNEVHGRRSAIRQAAANRILERKLENVPAPLREDLRAALAAVPGERTEIQRYLVEKLQSLVAATDEEIVAEFTEQEQQELAAVQEELARLEGSLLSPEIVQIRAFEDICWAVMNTNEFLFQH